MVVVVEDDQTTQTQVARERRRLVRNALLQAAVTAKRVNVVVDDGEALLVEGGGEVRLGNRHTHGVGHALAQRTGGDLHTGSLHLGMTGSLGSELTEALQIIESELRVMPNRRCLRRSR